MKKLKYILTQNNLMASLGLYTVAGIFIIGGIVTGDDFAPKWGGIMLSFFWIMNLAMYSKKDS